MVAVRSNRTKIIHILPIHISHKTNTDLYNACRISQYMFIKLGHEPNQSKLYGYLGNITPSSQLNRTICFYNSVMAGNRIKEQNEILC